MIEEAGRLSAILLRLAEDKVDDKRRDLSAKEVFPYVISDRCFPSRMIMPLQDALTGSLPATPETVRSHNPFPSAPVQIIGRCLSCRYVLMSELDDRVEIMPSLQRPKKLIFKGDNGRKYPFLCKPHDDLRKDARLMDFNAMINKLLNRASESRRRHLCVFGKLRSKLIIRYPNLCGNASERGMRTRRMGSQYERLERHPREGLCQI